VSETQGVRAEWGVLFGLDATRYDRARPSYPTAMVDQILSACPGPDVLDVGCGTGISTRLFVRAGANVLGVEVDARMAALARQSGLLVEVAPFEDWDPAGRTFDAVVAGQAWHWVDPDAGAAKAADVLRPAGRVALFWNVFQPSPDVARAFSRVNQRVLSGPLAAMWDRPALDGYAALCTRAANGLRASGSFDDDEQWRYVWERPYSRGEWLDQVPTFGGFGHLPDDQRHALLAGIGEAVDSLGGHFVMPYTTVVVTARRAGAS
jgi:SAM-dependent methyltransferase